MINKKSYTCLLIILILLILGISAVSAEDNVDKTVKNTTVTKSTMSNTNTHETLETNQKIEKNEKQNIIENKENTITQETNTTNKLIKKTKQIKNIKTSETPSTEGYNIIQVSTIEDMTNNINTKTYYNLTKDISISLTTNPLIDARGKDFIINGNDYTITYTGTNNRWLFNGNTETNLTLYNVTINNYKSGIVQTGINNLNVIDSTITNCGILSNGNSKNIKIENSNLNNTGSVVAGTTVNINIENSNFTTVTANMFTGANSGIVNINNSYFNNTYPILGGTSINVNLNNSRIENNKQNYIFGGANSDTINIQNTNITNLAASIIYTANNYKNLCMENVNINGSGNYLFQSSNNANINMTNVNISNLKGNVFGNVINANIKDVTVKNITGSLIGGTSTSVSMSNVDINGTGASVMVGASSGAVSMSNVNVSNVKGSVTGSVTGANFTDVNVKNVTGSFVSGTSTTVSMSNVNLTDLGTSVLSGNAGSVCMTDVNVTGIGGSVLGGTSSSVSMSNVNLTGIGASVMVGATTNVTMNDVNINNVKTAIIATTSSNVNMTNVNISTVGGSIIAGINNAYVNMTNVNMSHVGSSILAVANTGLTNMNYVNTNNVTTSIIVGLLPKEININNSVFNNTGGTAITVGIGVLNIVNTTFNNSKKNAIFADSKTINVADSNFLNGNMSAISVTGPGYVTISDTRFINNTNPGTSEDGTNAGGGAILTRVTTENGGYLLVDDCDFINNSAARGGAIFGNDPMVINITNSYFANNSAKNNSRTGGIYDKRGGGGALYMEDGPTLYLINNNFENNTVTDPDTGIVTKNNIVLTETTNEQAVMSGYNNQVDGVYVTDAASSDYGIYAKSQDETKGFHTYVVTYNTTTTDIDIDATINETITFEFTVTETNFHTELENVTINVTFNNPNGTQTKVTLVTDTDGHAYYDYRSDKAGTLSITAVSEDVYAPVLRNRTGTIGLENELVYTGSTSNLIHTINRLNTVVTSDVRNYTEYVHYAKNFTINIVDANNNQVTSGNVDLIVDGTLLDTQPLVNGVANFSIAFNTSGNRTLNFNYTGTSDVYDTSLITANANILSLTPVLSINSSDVFVGQPISVNVSLTFGDDNRPAQNQEVLLDLLGIGQVTLTTDIEGKASLTEEAGGIYNSVHHVIVDALFMGNTSQGFNRAENTSSFNVYKYNSSLHIVYKYGNRIGNISVYLNGSDGLNITSAEPIHVTIRDSKNGYAGVNIPVVNGYGSVLTDVQFDEDTAHVTAEYGGNGTYNMNNTPTFEITANYPTITGILVPELINVEEEFIIRVNLTNDQGHPMNGYPMIIKVNNVTVSDSTTITNNMGYVDIPYTAHNNTSIEVFAMFEGDSSYEMSNDTASINGEDIVRIPTSIIISVPESVSVYDPFTFNITLADTKGLINTGSTPETISVLVNGEEVTATYDTSNNVYIARYTPLNNTDIVINASYAGSNVYMPSNNSNTELDSSKIVKIGTVLNVTASTNSTFAGDIVTISFKLTTADGTGLQGQKINITINGTAYNDVDLGSTGMTTRTFTSPTPIDNVLVTATYPGTIVYNTTGNSTAFNITKIPTITKVSVLNTTTGNVTLRVEVRTLDGHDTIVNEGTLQIDVGNSLTQYEAVNNTGESTTFRLTSNPAPTTSIGIHVSYTGTVLYAYSEGVNATDITRPFEYITVDKQNASLSLDVNDSVFVGESVNITGVLRDGFDMPITYQDIQINVTNQEGESIALPNNGVVRAGADGSFNIVWENSVYGNYTVNATFSGISTVNGITENKTFKVLLIPTSTSVTLANNTVGNVTLNVSVTDNRDGHGEAITTGSLIVEYNSITETIPVTGNETLVNLTITSTDSVSVNVVYVDNSNVYDTSRDENFNSINAVMDQSRLELIVTPENIYTETITVSGRLVDGLGKGFAGSLSFTFNDTAYSHNSVTTGNDGRFSFTMDAVKIGNITLTATYGGTDKVILGTSNTTIFNVNKIPTHTNVVIMGVDGDSEIVGVRVQNESHAYITTGNVDLYMGNTLIKTISLQEYQYEPFTDENSYVKVALTKTELDSHGITSLTSITANYTGTPEYNSSTGSYDGSIPRGTAILNVILNQSTAYINETVDITVTLTDTDNHPISGQVEITVRDRTYPITVNHGVGSTTIKYSNTTIGTYTVNGRLIPNALYEPTSDTENLEILRIPTTTLVTVLGNAWNKTSIKIEAYNNLTNELLDYGRIRVKIENTNKTDNYYDVTGEPILVDIVTLYSGEFPISITYQENDYYMQSTGIDKLTANDTNEEIHTITIENQKTMITISTNSPVYVGDVLRINGTLYNKDSNEYLAGQIIHFTINGADRGTNTTDPTGRYVFYYTTTQNGTYIAQVAYAGITNIEGNSSQTSYTVNKRNTTTIVSVLNNTVGNVTLSVNVTDIVHDNIPVNSGTLNITINDYSYTTSITGEETIVKLDRITTSEEYYVTVEFMEDYKYLSSMGLDNNTLDLDEPSPLTVISVENQTATLTVTTDKAIYHVGETVTITGTLVDGLNNNLTDVDLEVTVDGITQPTTRVTAGGTYTTTYVTGRNGTINITIKYNGNETINPITSNATFMVEKINTTTIVSVLNDTVGNVTISVNVTGDDHKVVTDGNISVTITGIPEPLVTSVNSTGSPTIIQLEDIISDNTYTVTVEYLGNGTYNRSTGVDEDGNEFSSITTQLQTPILTINVPETDNYVLGNVTITGQLLDAKGQVIPGEQYVTLTFNNQEITPQILVNSTTGEYTYTRETHFVGDVNVSVNYTGMNGKFTPQSNNASYNIIKIPTKTLVTLVNNTYGNVNVNVEVVDTVNNKNVSTGWLHVTFNSEEYSPTTITSNVTNIVLNAPEANRYTLMIIFNGTEYYDMSTGQSNGTGDAFDHIIVVKQNSTITINELNTTYVNDTLNITGRVTDGFGQPIGDGEEINIQIIGNASTVTRTAYITGGNGEYEFHEKVNYDSTYTITVNYGGTTTINASHNTTSVKVDKKDTSTTIRLVNSTVGNITLDVTVIDMFNTPITTGIINISIGTSNYTKQLENNTNTYKLDEITSTDEVKLVVTYLGNNVYNPSTGIDKDTGDANITFTPKARNSTITITVSDTNVRVNTTITVTGRLQDSLGNDIVGAPLIFEITNGNTTETITGYTTGQNGLYSYPRLTDITGPVTIKVIYEGSSDGTISGTQATASYTITKIPTTSHITSESYTPSNITYKVWFTPRDSENILKEGWFEIKVNGSEQNRSTYYFNESNDDQKFNISITNEGYTYITLGNEFYDAENYDRTGNVTYVYVTYHGNEIYNESSTSISELSEKGNLTVRITLDKDTYKVNEKVGFFVELVDKDGNRQNARINITIGNTTYQNVMSSRASGYSDNFTNETGRDYTIIVNYPGSGGWNPASGNLTFTLEKLETQTLVSIISNVNGNLTIGVVVNDTDNDEIVTSGNLEIVYLGQSQVIPVNSGETIIKLDVENPPSSLPVTVTYLENPTYKSSNGVNSSNTSQAFEHIIVEQQTAKISVNVNQNESLFERELYIGDKLVISGKLTNSLGTVSGKDITVTVSGTTSHTTTKADGSYEVIFNDGLSYKGNGTFTVTVVYEGNDTVARATNQTTYTVYKIPTNTVIAIDSNIAGNVTLNVTVYDSVSSESIRTGYVYFYNVTGSAIALVNLETSDSVQLPITTSGTYTITAKYIENAKYLNSTGKDKDGNELNSIIVLNQTPKITISVSEDSVILGESVTINGTVINELNTPITGQNLVKISIGDDIYYASLYNGEYRLVNVTTSIGEKTVNATFTGIPGSVNSITSENRTFNVNRIPTKTLVTLANTTVGNASIDVRVINSTGANVTSGQLKVTVNGEELDDLVTITSTHTIIPLPSVTSMGQVNVNVEYQRNTVYDNSTGIDAETLDGDETIFTGFNTTKQASKITIATNNTSPKIGEIVNITGTLYDDREVTIDGTDIVNITIDDESYLVSVKDGNFSLENITVARGIKTVTATYNGNNSINGSSADTSFNVQLIPTSTNVTIVSNLVENFTVDVVVRDYHDEIVTMGNFSVYLNGVTKTVPVNETGTTRVYVDVNYARPNVAFTVTYLENSVYESSKGMRSTGEELTNITIHGLTPDISVSATSPRNVSQVVTINGTLKDELNRTIKDTVLSVNVNGTQYNNVKTDNMGRFSIEYTPQTEGVFTANVTYSGSGNIYGGSKTVDFTVNRIETSTLVELADTRVDNVTIKVTVKGLDGSNVTNGKFNVTIDGINTTYNITGDETIAKLDITSTGEHSVKVFFLDNNKYINSTGKTATGTEFGGLNATMLDSHITISADPLVIRVGNNVTISGVLTDDLDRIIPNAPITLIFDDGITEPVSKYNTTDNNGHYSFTGETHLTGTVNVTVVYNGDTNKINGTNNSLEYKVQKLPTMTRVTVLNYTRTNLTLHIVFEDTINVHEIREGKFNVTVHNVYLDEYDIADYLVDGQVIFKIPESALDDDYDEALICFMEDNKYLPSNTTAKGNLEKLPTHINITLNENEHYINETFDIHIKLISNDEAISGNVTYTLGETTQTINVPVEGYTITGYSSNSSGIKQITATFNENRTYYESSNTTSFNINKLPTMTLVTILNDTVGNTSIMVVVNDTHNNKIVTNGTLTITVGSNKFNHTITGPESIIKLTVNKTNTYLLVNYLENNDYQSSYGVDNTTHEDIRNIDVKSQIPSMTITHSGDTNVSYTVTITGDLLDGMNHALTGKLVVVTVNGTTLENNTDENGHYTVYYTANHNGTYTAVATYTGNASIEGATVNTTFTVSKIDTTTIVSVLNNTVGNVTIGVNVTGKDNSKVLSGKLNVTVNNTSTIHPITGEETVIHLGLNTTETVIVHVEFMEDDKYHNSIGMTNDSIASGNPEEFTGITADKENVTLVVNAIEENVDVGTHIRIDITLTNGMGQPVTGYVNLTFNDEDEDRVLVENGHRTYDRATHFAGEVIVNGTFYGNSTANNATATDTYHIHKIATNTTVSVENNTVGNYTILVHVVDKYEQIITNGEINVTVNGVTTTHNITGSYTPILLENVTDTTKEYTVEVVYLGSDKYENSTGMTRESVEEGNPEKFETINPTRQEATLTIGVEQSSIYVYHDITYNGTLTDGLGKPVNATVNITVMYGNEEVGFNGSVEVTNGEYSWTRTSIRVGEINVTVRYAGNDNLESATASTTYIINKRPTITLVDVINNTVGNVEISITVKDNITMNTIENGTLNVAFNGETHEINITGTDTHVKLNVTGALTYAPLSVKYLGNTTYNESIGVNKTSYEEDSTDPEPITNIEVIKQTANMTITNSGDSKVGYTVVIEGYLKDGMEEPIEGRLISVTISNATTLTNYTSEDGHYMVHFKADHNGTYTANATYNGNSMVASQTVSTTFTITKLETTTAVSVLNNTVGNVTLGVNVTDEYGISVTSGQVNVTVNGTSKLYPVTSKITPIRIGLNTTEHVNVKVVFLEDDTYLNSTGITNDTIGTEYPEVFTGITADKENVTLIINALEENVDVGRHVTIDIRLNNGMGEPISGYVNLTFNGEDEDRVYVSNGHHSYDRSTHFAGTVTVNGTFYENSTANKQTATDTYNINKIATHTLVSVENSTIGNVTIKVEVFDKYTDEITSGIINVTLNGTTSSHTITGKYTYITIENMTSMLDTYTITVVYNGSEKYENSTGITHDSYQSPEGETPFTSVETVKQNATITIIEEPNQVYVHRNVTYKGNLTDGLGNKLNGTVKITVMYGDEIVDINNTVQVINGEYNWTRQSVHVGEINVTVEYGGNDNINPANASTTYTIKKIPTATLVDLLNSTSGNVTIDVTVIDTTITGTENNVSTGTLQISIPGKTFTVEVTSKNTTIPLELTSVKPTSVTVKYLSNEVYDESTGVNKTSYEENPEDPEEFTEIIVDEIVYTLTVNSTPKTVYIGEPVTINGTLLDASGQPVKRTKLIIDINTDSETTRTDDTGYYSITYTPDYSGSYDVNVTYLGSRTVSEIIVNDTFNVLLRPTITLVSIESGTAGNVTLNVTVKDYSDEIVKTGTVIVTDGSGNMIGEASITGEYNLVKLDISGDGTFNIKVEYQENSVYNKSIGVDRDTLGELTGVSVVKQTANLTVDTSQPEVYVGHNNTIIGTLLDGLGNGLNTTVNVNVNGTPYENINVENGKYIVPNVVVNTIGIVTVNVTYAGNENITSINTSTTYNVNKKPLNVTTNVTNNTLGNTTINITIDDPVDGEKINGTVIITLPDGTNVTEPITNGTANVTVDIPVPGGDYNVTIIPEDPTYNKTVIKDTITIQPRNSTITANVSNNTAGNVTVDVEVRDPVTGHPITEGYVNVTVDGETLGRVPVGPDGLATIPVSIKTNGTYNLVANYEGTENYTGSSYKLDSEEIFGRNSNITVEVTNTSYGNTTINITLVDPTTNETFNGTVNITLPNGTNITANITNGSINITIDVPVPGGDINITYPGDDVHNGTNITIPVNVTPRNSTITASVSNNTAGNVTVDVEVRDPVTGHPITEGYVNVTVDGETLGRVPVGPDGMATIPVSIIANGTYNLVANYEGTENYTNSSYHIGNQAIVGRSSNITVEITNNTQGNTTINITLVDPTTNETFNGTVNITLPDNSTVEINITNGSIEIPIDVPVPGGNITITYPGDETHNTTNITIPVTVNKRDSTTTANVTNTTAGNVTVKVKVTDPTTGLPVTSGYVNITLNDEVVGRMQIDKNGEATIPTSINKTRKITLIANYEGNENYTSSYYSIDSFTVMPKESQITANLTNTTRGETNVNITLEDPITGEGLNGTVTLILPNGTRQPVTIENGTGIVPVDLPVGNNTIKVVYPGDDKYNETEYTFNVTVQPRDVNVTVKVTNNTQGNTTINVTIEDPATGEPINTTVTVTLPNGTNITVPVNGSTIIPIDLPVPGGNITVTIPEDENYEGYNTTIPVTVNPRDSKITATVTNKTAGNTTVTVKVTDPVTGKPITEGTVELTVDGKPAGKVPVGRDGTVTMSTGINTTGKHSITAKYDGRPNYKNSTTTLNNIEVQPRSTTVTATVTNNTQGNTTVKVTIKDTTTGEGLNGTVIVTLPNGTNITTKTNNGIANIPVNLPVGNNTIKVTYPGDKEHDTKTINVPVNVTPRTSTTTATVTNNTAGNTTLKVTVKDTVTGKPVTEGYVNVTVNGKLVGRNKVDSTGCATIQTSITDAGKYTIIANYEPTTNYKASSKTINNVVIGARDTNMQVTIDNSTVGSTKITVTLNDTTTGKPVTGNVTVTLPNGTKVNIPVGNTGTTTVAIDLPSGTGNVKVTYPGDNNHKSKTVTTPYNISKVKVKLVVDTVYGTIGEDITLIAHVNDEKGNPVSGGNLVFKLNGRSLRMDGRFDTNDTSPMKLQVNNGLVKITMKADLYLRNGKNITASYSGSYKYESAKGNVAIANIKKRNATLTVKVSPTKIKQNNDITITIKLKDITKNTQNTKAIYTNASLLLKINGVTLKDTNGENLLVPVDSSTVTYIYHVPSGTGAIDTKGNIRNYTVEAVYVNSAFYPDTRNKSYFNVERSIVNINIKSVTVKKDVLSVKANLTDYEDKLLVGTNKVCLKINGKTYKQNGKVYYASVHNGKIDLKGLKLPSGTKVKTLTIVTGERQPYYGAQVTTKDIKT